MATAPNASKPQRRDAPEELMRQAERSTANLGWLQDYISEWNVLVHAADRIIKAQNQQSSFDQEARAHLIAIRAFGKTKLLDLSEAYDKAYVRHMSLMEKVMQGGE